MAAADYYSCDVCGHKTFYDANLDYDHEKPEVDYGCGVKLIGVGDMACICDGCAKRHEVKIVEKASYVTGA